MSNSEDLRVYIASLKENTNTGTAMIYTKSEIREAKKRITHELKRIKEYLPVQESNWLPWHMVLSSIQALNYVLKPLKTYIIDNDDYNLAVEINKMITPVWYDYCANAKDDASLQHQQAYEVQDIINDLRDWIGEYEAEHPKQEQPTTATNSTSTNKGIETADSLFDKETLKTLFVKGVFNDDYDIQDTSEKSIKLSRFDKFCQRLEMALTDTDKKLFQKDIASIAYMIYCSQYTKTEYHIPKRKSEKGCFANLIRTFFDIVRIDRPSETSPNKYDEPSQYLIELFGDILKWEESK